MIFWCKTRSGNHLEIHMKRPNTKLIILVFIVLLFLACTTSKPEPCDSSMVPVRIFIDPEVGCHYIREGLRGEYLRNRNDVDGRQYCPNSPHLIVPNSQPRTGDAANE